MHWRGVILSQCIAEQQIYQLNTPIFKTNLHGKSFIYASFAFTWNYDITYRYLLDMQGLKRNMLSFFTSFIV